METRVSNSNGLLDPRFNDLTLEEMLKIIPHKSFSEHYEIGPKRGKGSQGIVYEVTRKSDGSKKAAKIHIGRMKKSSFAECLFMSTVKDPYVLGCEEYFTNTDEQKDHP